MIMLETVQKLDLIDVWRKLLTVSLTAFDSRRTRRTLTRAHTSDKGRTTSTPRDAEQAVYEVGK